MHDMISIVKYYYCMVTQCHCATARGYCMATLCNLQSHSYCMVTLHVSLYSLIAILYIVTICHCMPYYAHMQLLYMYGGTVSLHVELHSCCIVWLCVTVQPHIYCMVTLCHHVTVHVHPHSYCIVKLCISLCSLIASYTVWCMVTLCHCMCSLTTTVWWHCAAS